MMTIEDEMMRVKRMPNRRSRIPLKRIENKQNKVMIGSMKVAALGEILLSAKFGGIMKYHFI